MSTVIFEENGDLKECSNLNKNAMDRFNTRLDEVEDVFGKPAI